MVYKWEIDETNYRILNALQQSGRMSNADLADRTIKDYVSSRDRGAGDRQTTVFVEIWLSGQADEMSAAF